MFNQLNIQSMQLKLKFYLIAAAIFVAGAVTGAGALTWKMKGTWDQWLLDFNMQPLIAEQTHGLKELREGNITRLQDSLEEAVWRSISLLAQEKLDGKPLPAQAGREIKYHCAYDAEHMDAKPSELHSQRQQWCTVLLKHYAAID
jgi:hypothetical protein